MIRDTNIAEGESTILVQSESLSQGGNTMAKIKSSVRGKQQKKIVVVKGYTKKNGTKVPDHRRSTPN